MTSSDRATRPDQPVRSTAPSASQTTGSKTAASVTLRVLAATLSRHDEFDDLRDAVRDLSEVAHASDVTETGVGRAGAGSGPPRPPY